jgi:succinoglycan biosynthesis protein ExoV
MKVYYWKDEVKCPKGNFGDELNLWLWPKLIPNLLEREDKGWLVGIGTLLNQKIPNNGKIAVFGSGIGYGQHPSTNSNWHIYCLRGPKTAAVLKVDSELAVTDSALLVRNFYSVNYSCCREQKAVAFMPHWQTPLFPWKQACEEAGITYIDPSEPVEEILFKIANARFLLAEAMHGAIVADALRVPWIAISTRPSINTFKWLDWCSSMEVEYQPVNLYWKRFTPNIITQDSKLSSLVLPLVGRSLKSLVNSVKPRLSEEKVLMQKENTLQQKLDELRYDWESGVFG